MKVIFTRGIKAIITITITLSGQGCDPVDRTYPLNLKNNSFHSITVFLNCGENFMALYPDTTVSTLSYGIGKIPSQGKQWIAGGGKTWENSLKNTAAWILCRYLSFIQIQWQNTIGRRSGRIIKF